MSSDTGLTLFDTLVILIAIQGCDVSIEKGDINEIVKKVNEYKCETK